MTQNQRKSGVVLTYAGQAVRYGPVLFIHRLCFSYWDKVNMDYIHYPTLWFPISCC